MKRVAIIGSSGAGKSTLSIRLADFTGIPLYHLDRLYWEPNWVKTPRPEFRKIQQQIVVNERWIIDGNYNSTLDERLPFADTIIFLDYPRWICLIRVLKRQVLYRKKSRPDLPESCEERLEKIFLRWVWNFPKEGRTNIFKYLNILTHNPQILIFTTPKQATKWLNGQKG